MNNFLTKDCKDWTEEELDRYARIVADQINYAKFRGIPLVSLYRQIEIPAGSEYMNSGIRLQFI